jgi:hypothetical protein
MIKAPDHVQVAMPAGGKRGRDFYSSPLGLKEPEKAAALAGRAGAWFALPDRGNRTSSSRSPSSLAGMPTRRSSHLRCTGRRLRWMRPDLRSG